jgi:3-mercaptopropionate dioxygenase
VIQGAEHEQRFSVDADGCRLSRLEAETATAGDVVSFVPPHDIHQVGNPSDENTVSIHVYGTDIARLGSSTRRYYDLPIN